MNGFAPGSLGKDVFAGGGMGVGGQGKEEVGVEVTYILI